MDIHPAYSYLLGRPQIHVVGSLTSTLHKKLKFLFEYKLVIVYGAEDSIISGLSSFRHVKTKEGIVKVPFQGLYFEEVSPASVNQSKSTALVLSSAKSDKQTLKNGPLPVRAKL